MAEGIASQQHGPAAGDRMGQQMADVVGGEVQQIQVEALEKLHRKLVQLVVIQTQLL